MAEDVVITMTAQDADLVAAWQRARQGPQQFGEAVEQAGRKGKKAGQDTKQGMDEASRGILQFAGGMVGISSAWGIAEKAASLYKSALDAIIQRQKEALGQSVGLESQNR